MLFFLEGGAFVGVFNLHFSFNFVLSQNHQIHTWGYFPFVPFERQSRSVTIVPASSAESASYLEREREMYWGTRFVDNSSVLLSFRSSAFSLFGSSIQTRSPAQESAHTQCPERVPRSLIPLYRYRVCSCLDELKLNSPSQDLNPRHSTGWPSG